MTGCTTLINSTLNSLLNHVMQYIKIPRSIISQLERYQCNFLWGITPTKKKIHLLNRNTVTTPKSRGGLGIQRLPQKNESLLASQAWRMIQNPSSLWAATILHKYFLSHT